MNNIETFYQNFDLISKLFFDEESKNIINFSNNFLNKEKFCSDIGCGYGFISNQLIAKEIHGFDISQYLLDKANENKKENTFYHYQDCSLAFDDTFINKFDVTFCMRSAFGVFKDFSRNESYFKNLVDITKSKGTIVLDIYNPYLIENYFKKKISYLKDNYQLIRNSQKENNYVEQDWCFYKDNNLISSNKLGVYIFKMEEMEYLIKKYNLKTLGIYGDYELTKYHNLSNRLIFVLQKS